MKRTIYPEFAHWAARSNRKPLLLFGARQVGKTWAMSEFGKRAFAHVVRYDLASDAWARQLFAPDLDARRIIGDIEIKEGRHIDPATTLIIFDEIQEEPRALTALKYFCEDAREYPLMAAGSYLGITHHEGSTFPVGKIDTLTLRPMTFEEFLQAMGDGLIAEALAAGELARLERATGKRLTERLRQYFVVGGMPEAVAVFADSQDYRLVRRIQHAILSAYDGDFSKHAPLRIVERMRLAWNSLPAQLARENRKFVYGAARAGARAKDFEESIQWLRDYGVVNKISRASALRQPLKAYEDLSAFKLFALDVGLLSAMSGLMPEAVIEGAKVFTEFKGALTEQYAAQELIASGLEPLYWSAERSTAEVDFAVSHNAEVIPIEVKAAENLKAKSLRVACDKFKLQPAVRTSLSGYRDDGWLINIPLWSIGRMAQILNARNAPNAQ